MPKKEPAFKYQVCFDAGSSECKECRDMQEFYFDKIPKRPHDNCNCDIAPVSENNTSRLGEAEIKTTEKTEKIELKTFDKPSKCETYEIDETFDLVKDIPEEIKDYEDKVEVSNFSGGINFYNDSVVLTNIRKGEVVKVFLAVTYRVIKIKVPIIVTFTYEGKVVKEYVRKWIIGEIKVPIEATPKVKRYRKK